MTFYGHHCLVLGKWMDESDFWQKGEIDAYGEVIFKSMANFRESEDILL